MGQTVSRFGETGTSHTLATYDSENSQPKICSSEDEGNASASKRSGKAKTKVRVSMGAAGSPKKSLLKGSPGKIRMPATPGGTST